jgi:hypothetical protein
MMRTTNAGATWTPENLPVSRNVSKMFFITPDEGWVAGDEFVLHTRTSGILSVPLAAKPAQFSLSQNYPNPFNPSTTIRYTLTKAGAVSLTVFDILGRKVADLINQRQQPGEHAVVFSAPSRASGVYFYRLSSPDGVQTKKMLLIR